MSTSTPTLQPNRFTTRASKPYFYLTAGPADGPLFFFLHGWPGIALTWKHQLLSLAGLGFRVVAPDLPGYGETWTSQDPGDFALDKLVPDLLELLAHLGRKQAIWVGHDWGCGPLWAIAAHHPDVCRAVVGISVPYRTLELGLEKLLTLIDRDLYPEDEFPNGPWDYQVFYEQNPAATDRQFESDVPRYAKLIFSRGSPESGLGRAVTVDVVKSGGWFGGHGPHIPDLPLEHTVLDQEMHDALVAALTKTGYKGATSWYLNHAANRKYAHDQIANDAVLKIPVLFVHTEYDAVCQTTTNPKIMEPMREKCESLTEISVKAGHWGQMECPEEVNAGIASWVVKQVADWWPGPELKSQS